jgi:hypothetical protein
MFLIYAQDQSKHSQTWMIGYIQPYGTYNGLLFHTSRAEAVNKSHGKLIHKEESQSELLQTTRASTQGRLDPSPSPQW